MRLISSEIFWQSSFSGYPLEEMIKLYEEGTALAAKCAKVLDAAQLKITELTAGKADKDE